MSKKDLERLKTLLVLGNDKLVESKTIFKMVDGGELAVTIAPKTSDKTITTAMDQLRTE